MDTTTDFWAEIDQVSRRRARRRLGVLVAALAVGASGACSFSTASDDPAAAATTVPAAPTTVVAPADPGTPSDADAPADAPADTPTDTPDAPPAPTGPAPTVDSFVTPENIDCHNGDFQEFTASWTTTGADRVTIAIDGSGVYAEYAADGETSLPFNCSSPHTFTLVAIATDGRSDSRQITLQPRNAQGGDDDAPTDDVEAAADQDA